MTAKILHGPHPEEPLQNATLGSVIHESLLHNDNQHDAIVDAFTGETITYKQILQESCDLAESLRLCGFGPNSVLSISSENNVQFLIPVISSLYIGSSLFPINHSYTELELNHAIQMADFNLIFCSKLTLDKYRKFRETSGKPFKIIVINSGELNLQEDTQSLSEFTCKTLKNKKVCPRKFKPFQGSPNQCAFIMCSSGTTGLPKGVMLSHKNLLVRLNQSRDSKYSILKPQDSILGILPFFHAYGLITSLCAVINGYKIISLARFDEDVFLKAIQDHKITILWLAPPLVVFLAKSPKVLKYNLTSIKEIFCGAAPLSKSIEETVCKRLNLPPIKQGYGLTEATLATVIMGTNQYCPGSSGKVITFMSCKVRDPETGKTCKPNEVGELCFKGPMVMLGYYKNEQATKETFTEDGWLRTGDLGYYDENEFFFIVDRLKELIKYKGFQVAPAELEAILLTNPKIRDVGVVGRFDENSGELPMAFVVKHPNTELTVQEVKNFVKERVSPQKQLRGGVIFLDEIPKNPSGKILRRQLRLLITKILSKL